ncbi:prestin-like [Diadema antillarum]|uniref:prestin-like n=1 Tax=Diadema antillarum TaxID=105358 RepID=UPI003A8A1CE0
MSIDYRCRITCIMPLVPLGSLNFNFLPNRTFGDKEMAAFEEVRDMDADLHSELRKRRNVYVSRPAYTEQSFQHEHEETIKEQVNIATRVRRGCGKMSLSCNTVKKFFISVVPILSWLPEYDLKGWLLSDIISGTTVGIFRIPLGMAHAILADLSPIYGLYTSFFPALVYAIFGTSRQLNIGTFAVVSIMAGTAIDKVMDERMKELSQSSVGPTVPPIGGPTEASVTYGSSSPPGSGGGLVSFTPAEEMLERAKIGALLAMMVGMIQLTMGIFRLGFVTCYLAEPLVRGFTSGAAFHVFTSQFNKLFGVPVPRYSGPFALPKTYKYLFTHINQTNVCALINSFLVVLFLIIVKELQDRYKDKLKFPLPTELFVIIMSTVASYTGNLSKKYGMPIVGEISSSSLPAPFIPPMQYAHIIMSDAFVIAIVGFSISVSLTVIFAKRNKYEMSSNQELLGYGASNVLSGFFFCYPCSGSLSRTLLQDLAGGKTQIAGIISTIPILLVLFLLTQFFEALPVGCLAGIVVVALRGMFRQFRDIKELWKFSKIDCMLWIVTCSAVILLGVDIGLGVGVAVAIFSIVIRTQRPKCCIMGNIPETDIYRDLSYYDAAVEIPSIKIYRVNAPVYFANAEFVKQRMYSLTGINPPKILQERAKEERKEASNQAKYNKNNKNSNNRDSTPEDGQELQTVSADVKTNDDIEDETEINTEAITPQNSSLETGLVRTNNHQNHRSTSLVKTIIMDFGAVSFVDAMGLSTLKVIIADYEKVDIDVVLANCRGPIRALMYKSGFLDLIGLDKIYVTLHDAVLHSVDSGHQLLSSRRSVPDPAAVVMYRLNSTEAEESPELTEDVASPSSEV